MATPGREIEPSAASRDQAAPRQHCERCGSPHSNEEPHAAAIGGAWRCADCVSWLGLGNVLTASELLGILDRKRHPLSRVPEGST
jgi:hypothetical protein